MKLSEAIRLGSMLKPQGFGALHSFRSRWFRRSEVASCALGAAVDAAGCPTRPISNSTGLPTRGTAIPTVSVEVPSSWAFLLATWACSACYKIDRIDRLITHLNDDHRWTREQVADWVATIEPQETEIPCDHGKHATLAAQ